MPLPKFGFQPSTVTITTPHSAFSIPVFVDGYDPDGDAFLVCGNVRIVDMIMPLYGCGQLVVQVIDPNAEDTTAVIHYRAQERVSILIIILEYATKREPYRHLPETNELEVDTRWLSSSGVQIVVDGNIVRVSRCTDNAAYFTLPVGASIVKITSRFFADVLDLTPVMEAEVALSTCSYELTLAYDKCTLRLDASAIVEPYVLIEGDFKLFTDLSPENRNQSIVTHCHTYFKTYKYFKFSVNGIVQERLVIKPSAFPTVVNWLGNQHRLRFNTVFEIAAVALINGKHEYSISEGSNEILVDPKVTVRTLCVKDTLSHTTVFEKTFEVAQTTKAPLLPDLWIDVINRELRLSSTSKQVVEVTLKGYSPIVLKPGEIKAPLPYQMYYQKGQVGIVRVEIESATHCEIKRYVYYISL